MRRFLGPALLLLLLLAGGLGNAFALEQFTDRLTGALLQAEEAAEPTP